MEIRLRFINITLKYRFLFFKKCVTKYSRMWNGYPVSVSRPIKSTFLWNVKMYDCSWLCLDCLERWKGFHVLSWSLAVPFLPLIVMKFRISGRSVFIEKETGFWWSHHTEGIVGEGRGLDDYASNGQVRRWQISYPELCALMIILGKVNRCFQHLYFLITMISCWIPCWQNPINL